MDILANNRDLVEIAEAAAKFPIQVKEDATLPFLCTTQLAQGKTFFHIILIKRNKSAIRDAAIAIQCYGLIRRFSVPDASRNLLRPIGNSLSQWAGNSSCLMIGNDPKRFLALFATRLEEVCYIVRSKSALLNEAQLFFEQIVAAALFEQSLLPNESLTGSAPTPLLLSAFQTVNIAFMLFWEEILGMSLFETAPFAEQRATAEMLLAVARISNENSAFDQAVVGKWMDILGVREEFDWQPYQPPHKPYWQLKKARAADKVSR